MIKIGINGFGRIGRLVFRAAICADDIEVVAVNAPDKTPEQLAYTVKYDSVHGRFHGTVDCEGGENPALIVNGKRVALLNNRDAKLLPWGELGVDRVPDQGKGAGSSGRRRAGRCALRPVQGRHADVRLRR